MHPLGRGGGRSQRDHSRKSIRKRASLVRDFVGILTVFAQPLSPLPRSRSGATKLAQEPPTPAGIGRAPTAVAGERLTRGATRDQSAVCTVQVLDQVVRRQGGDVGRCEATSGIVLVGEAAGGVDIYPYAYVDPRTPEPEREPSDPTKQIGCGHLGTYGRRWRFRRHSSVSITGISA